MVTFQMLITIALCVLVILLFLTYGSMHLNLSRLDTSRRPIEEVAQKKLATKQKHKKYMKIMVISFAIILVIRISLVVIPFLQKNDIIEAHSNKTLTIVHTKNDVKKNVNEVFVRDETKNYKKTEKKTENQLKEEKIADYQQKLHMDWMENLSYKIYGRKLIQIYSVVPNKKDDSLSSLSPLKRSKVNSNSVKIEKYQKMHNEKKQLTEEESVQEFQLYQDTYDIYATSDILYQSGRAAEDAFWAHYNGDNTNYEKLLEYAANSISCFEQFLTFVEKKVYIEGSDKNVQTEDLFLRNGKIYFRLRDYAVSNKDKLHFDLCSYSCFSNITINVDKQSQYNEWSILGYYYLCHSIQNILSDDTQLSNEEYEQFVDEGKTAVRKALALYKEMDSEKNPKKYKTESNVRKELNNFEKIFENYARWASAFDLEDSYVALRPENPLNQE